MNPEIDWRRNHLCFMWHHQRIELTMEEKLQPGIQLHFNAMELKQLAKEELEGVICVIREEDIQDEKPRKKLTPKEQIRWIVPRR